MDPILSRALREFTTGPLNQLLVNLGGKDGQLWEEELNKFNRKEPCWPDNNKTISRFENESIDMVETFSFEFEGFLYTVSKDTRICSGDAVFHPKYGIGRVFWAKGRTYVDYLCDNPYLEKNKKIGYVDGYSLSDIPAHNCGGRNYDGQMVIVSSTKPSFEVKMKS